MNIADGVGEIIKVNCFSSLAGKGLLSWAGAAATEYWGGLNSSVCAGSLREKDHFFKTTNELSVTSDDAL